MWKRGSIVCVSLAPIPVGFLVEPWLPLGHWGWGAVAVACCLPALVTYRRSIWSFIAHRGSHVGSFSDFDVAIQDAIDHLIHTTPHSFTRSSLAERSAFQALLEAMRAGRLPVIGMKGEHGIPQQISPRQCSKLHPIEVATLHGVRFHLVDESTKTKRPETLIERSDPLGFSGLRVRSDDLYRIWPKDQQSRSSTAQEEW